MRRSKGEGSIYRRKDGLWVARYEAAGKRRYLYAKTRKAVAEKLKERLSSAAADLDPEGGALRVEDYLKRWLSTVKGTVKERTWQRHEEVVRLHLNPSLGKAKLGRLNALDVQELYLSKLDSGLSPRTVEIIHTTLRKALKQAMRWSLVSRNVTEDVTPPKPRKKEARVLSQGEAKRLLEAAKGERFEALYVLAITTGMRQGELLGLRWEDIELEEGILRVRRTVWGGQATAPKSANSKRSIRLSRMAVEVLREQRENDGRWGWIFSTRNDTPVDCHNLINRSWWPLLEKAGLPKIPFHTLRHTSATLLLSKGVHPKVVCEMLGHSSITITLDTYSHVLPNIQEKAAKAMEDIFE